MNLRLLNRAMNIDNQIKESALRLKYFKWIPVIHFMAAVVTSVGCYYAAVVNNGVSVYLPFLSEVGKEGVQRVIFITGGVFVTNITTVMIVVKYLILRYFFCSEKYYWRLRNNWNCIIGLFSTGFLILVIAFPATSQASIHTGVAAIFLVTSLFYTCCDCFLNFHLITNSDQVSSWVLRIHRPRFFMCIFQLITCFTYLLGYQIAYQYWTTHNRKLSALKTPEDKGFWIVFITCLAEWVYLLLLVLYFLSFLFDFASFHITLQGIPRHVSQDVAMSLPEIPESVSEESGGKPKG
ncbi:uncharacterized protein CEXT_578752 [Caerostris extrusa]|uniref:CWH43-like N-terminal domain-containing protein n=1 Tax=Caerostris extrusa TaxID=172846 RepID=A0AAV4MLA4_CAEEX|nr:uncharacterized protein CEXT_578752 [Caerostris extrusa]